MWQSRSITIMDRRSNWVCHRCGFIGVQARRDPERRILRPEFGSLIGSIRPWRPSLMPRSGIEMPDLVIVGGGIVGWSAAYAAVRAGASVTVVDRADLGQATAAGAGILSPGTSIRLEGPMLDLSRAAVDFYPRLIADLAEDGETDTGFASPGILFLFRDAGELEQRPAVLAFAEERKRSGVNFVGEIRSVDGAQAKELFPALGEMAGAVHLSGASRVDGRKMRDSLRRAALRRGGRVIDRSAEIEADSSVFVDGDRVSADRLVIAGGAWTPIVASALGVDLAIYPQRGQILHVDMPDVLTSDWSILHGLSNTYVLTFPEHRVVAGATREDNAGWEYAQTAGGVKSQLDHALAAAPGLSEGHLVEVRIGFRPASRDGMPFLGYLPDHERVLVASGHGPGGLQNGPVSGAAVAWMALGMEPGLDLGPFDPGRGVR
jgi:D-amino-acid dehydrogenase